MLKAGDKAAEFSLPDQDGRLVTLRDLVAGGPLLLFFYPADFTPVCTREACLFRDRYADLAEAGVRIAGISPDEVASHQRFAETHRLRYSLLADPGKTAIRAYGVDGPLGFGVRRTSFLIDRSATIRAAVRADLRLKPHDGLIRQALAAL